MGIFENFSKLDIFGARECRESPQPISATGWASIRTRPKKHPVIITKNNRERLVMLSIEEYRRLKQLDRKALFVEELADADVEAISRAEVPVEHDHLSVEYEDYPPPTAPRRR